MTDIIRVQIVFSVDTQYGAFSDALYIPFEEYAVLKSEDIKAMKQARVDAWIDAIEHPRIIPELTKEELQQLKSDIDKEIVSLIARAVEIEQKIQASQAMNVGK